LFVAYKIQNMVVRTIQRPDCFVITFDFVVQQQCESNLSINISFRQMLTILYSARYIEICKCCLLFISTRTNL